MNRYTFWIFLNIIAFSTPIIYGQEDQQFTHDFSLEIEGEYRFFFTEGQFPGQEQHFPSIAVRPEYSVEWNDGYDAITFAGFARWDVDDPRTHFDVRELYYQAARGRWELGIGVKKVFWGVTESAHLVDIINQTDQVESFDGEQKLGQPMVEWSYITDNIGTFDIYYLPYARRRTFAGEKGRLRFSDVIAEDEIGYEGEDDEWAPTFAFRWSNYFGDIDIGLSQFYGNGREPLFAFTPTGEIQAFYPTIYQAGIDFQYTRNAFLWKLESIYRYADIQDFVAFAAGVEYTFSNINEKGLDIGVLTEYLYDSRDELALSTFQNDVFYGSRLAWNDVNDTSLLIGGATDIESGSTILSIEGSRRIGSAKLTIESRIFASVADDELLLRNFQDDSFLRIVWSQFF